MVVTPEKMPMKCTKRIPNQDVPSHPGRTPWYPARNNCEPATPAKKRTYSKYERSSTVKYNTRLYRSMTSMMPV